MRKSILFILTFIVLIGILNCTLIEPAFAYQDQDHCETSCQDETDCPVCHFSNHQWIYSQKTISFFNLLPVTGISHEIITTVPNPPAELIFHPPITL